jgi:hypothetical protein
MLHGQSLRSSRKQTGIHTVLWRKDCVFPGKESLYLDYLWKPIISIPLPPDQFLRERTQESFLVSAIALVFKRTAGRWLYTLGLGGTQVLRLKGHDAPRMKILRISLEQAESLLSPGIC